MKYFFIALITTTIYASESLEDWIGFQIYEIEQRAKEIGDESELNRVYYLLGKKNAYKEILEKMKQLHPEMISHGD